MSDSIGQNDNNQSSGATPAKTARSIRQRGWVKAILLALIGISVISFVLSNVANVREPAARMKSTSNLKLIGLAFHNYQDVSGDFPTNSYADDGTPLLSWRVHLLPFVEQDELYQQFKLDEPWDSPHNIRLLDKMPAVYRNPRGAQPPATMTYYRGFSNSGALFERRRAGANVAALEMHGRPMIASHKRQPLTFGDCTDDYGNTIVVVEAGEAVEWTKPDDLNWPSGQPRPAMGGLNWKGKVFLALMLDGSTRMLKMAIDDDVLRALITYNGGETLPTGWDR